MEGLQWWGYLHTNGSIQVKRYFDARDLSEARESPFVQRMTGTFEADSREEAIVIAGEKLNGNT